MRNQEKAWLRGNLHMHTSHSDGKLSLEEAVTLYEQAGYDFIAVTDHWVVSEKGAAPNGMLLFSGCEYNVGTDVREGIYHIVGAGLKRDPGLSREDAGLDAQRVIDAINDAGGIAILAHPAWSLNSADKAAKLSGLSGVEIYNTTSGFPRNVRPYSGLFVDQLASQGILLPCMAADDAHQYDHDVLGGWLMVYAQEKTHEAVMKAIRAGDFYATQGPDVFVSREGNCLHVECSPAAHVVFYSNDLWNPERVVSGEGITHANYRITSQDAYVRVEVIDSEGKRAFTSPIKADC